MMMVIRENKFKKKKQKKLTVMGTEKPYPKPQIAFLSSRYNRIEEVGVF